MKNIAVTLIFILFITHINAQEEMPEAWKIDLEHKAERVGTGLEGEFSYAASDKMITVFKTSDGSVVWSKPFKEIAPKLRKIDELIPFWKSKTIFLFEKKGGKDQIAVIDLLNGELLWMTDKYQNVGEQNVVYVHEEEGFAISLKKALVFIKTRTGEELWETDKFKGVVSKYIYGDGNITTVNFVPSGLGALFSGFKNQIVKINLKNGEIIWENTYIGRAQKKVITKEFIFDLTLEEDKIFLYLNGIQTYDYKTGAKLWAAAYYETPAVVKAPPGAKKFGVYGAVAKPIINGNDVYILETTSKKNQQIKKYDFNSGKLLWSSPEIEKAKAIPNMYIVDDMLILQIGGIVEAQAYIVKKESDGSYTKEWRTWYPNIKPWGLQGFSAKDGSSVWSSEKFKKGITNIHADSKFVYACSGKALYSLDYKTGSENYEVDVKADGIGFASGIIDYKDMLVVVGEKGLATHKKIDGKMVAANKYKKSTFQRRIEDIALMETEKSDIAAFDLKTCKYLEFNAKKDAQSELSSDGHYVYVYQKKNVFKLKTH